MTSGNISGREGWSVANTFKSYLFPFALLCSAAISILSHNLLWMMIPFVILFIWISIEHVHWIYFLMLASIPFSTELDLPGGLGTDFPDEVLMWWLCGIGGLYLLTNTSSIKKLVQHPVTWLLLIHWIWIFICCLGSQEVLHSLKYWLSKSWYLFIFYILAYVFLKNEKRISMFVWVSAIAACMTILVIEIRHSFTGFAFSAINTVVQPFYRNHVNYACLQVCLLPYVWALWQHYRTRLLVRNIIALLGGIMLMGIVLSYTRASYVALFSVAFFYPLIRFKGVTVFAVCIVLGVSIGMVYLQQHNHFLDYAPDYNKAISHTDFSSLLSATTQGKDISTMERLYRWVAGARMVGEKYIIGFGPGEFYNYYKPYTLNQFTTYVSNNPDRSTIHNYFLMTAVEQGIPGVLIFFVLIMVYFKQAEHSLFSLSTRYIKWALASLWSMGSILVILLFNDMIETDKVGSYFFINLAILVKVIDLDVFTKP